ncbi:hypothetical protein FRC10_000970 [Ceratobasidium sp. 414]|nr:hypothetical protein FRC10_000970 [Ceratobasidium sp. 414]
MVKASTSHFPQPAIKERKAGTESNKPPKRTRLGSSSATAPSEAQEPEGDDELPEDAASLGQFEEEPAGEHEVPGDGIDEARQQFDERTVNETTAEGLRYVVKVLGLTITDSMRAGKLAQKLHNSPTLQAKFETLIDAAIQQLRTARRALARRIATRWNSDYECLSSLKELNPCVQMLTAESANELADLSLDDTQWQLLDQLVRVLIVRLNVLFQP